MARVDDACAAALEVCVREYRFVRRYLEKADRLSSNTGDHPKSALLKKLYITEPLRVERGVSCNNGHREGAGRPP